MKEYENRFTSTQKEQPARFTWLCWFRHKWTKWSPPKKSWEYSCFYQQQRSCLRCGHSELRERYASS